MLTVTIRAIAVSYEQGSMCISSFNICARLLYEIAVFSLSCTIIIIIIMIYGYIHRLIPSSSPHSSHVLVFWPV